MIKLVLFDMDDTVYAERTYVISGFSAVAQYLHERDFLDYPVAYDALLRHFDFVGRRGNFDALCSKYGLPVSIIPQLVKTYRTHEPLIVMRDDVKEFLLQLKSSFSLCILTDGWMDVQKRKVRALGLDQFFEKIIYSQQDGLAFAKPHERFFRKALEYFRITPSETIMVGDDLKKDIEGARNLGIGTFHVTNLLDKQEQETLVRLIT